MNDLTSINGTVSNNFIRSQKCCASFLCSFTSRPPLLLSLAWILRLLPLRLFTLRADINFLATLAACTFWTASYQFNHIISNKCEHFQLFCIRTDMCCIIYHQFIVGKPFLMSSYFENFHYLWLVLWRSVLFSCFSREDPVPRLMMMMTVVEGWWLASANRQLISTKPNV